MQHCSRRTGYDMIVHGFDPESCDECLRIEVMVTEQAWGGWNPLAFGIGG